MFCKFCGAANDDDSRFCCSCGKSIEEKVAEAPQETVVNEAPVQQPEPQPVEAQPVPQYVQEPVQQYAPAPQPQNNQEPAPADAKDKKEKKKVALIVAIVAAVLAIIAGVLVVGMVYFSADTANGDEVVEAAVTEADAASAFDTLLTEHGNGTFSFIYCTSIEEIKANKVSALCDNVGVFYSWTAFTGELTNGTLKASDIMTQAEYDAIVKSGAQTWTVFKAADLQAKLDGMFGAGKYNVKDFVTATTTLTASGYLLVDEELAPATDLLYYGKVASCQNVDGEFVVEANILRCDNALQMVYDEATGVELSAGTVTPGTNVNFDSIVTGLQINKALMGTVTFTYSVVDNALVLVSVVKPDPVEGGAVSKVTTQAAPQISGEVISISSYGRYVKAGGGLNMRALPSTYAAKVSNIPNGGYVTVIGKSPYYSDWVYVSYGGYNGWVNANYLVTYQPTVSYGGYYATVRAGGGLNIRNSPGGSKIGNVPNGATVYIHYFNDAGTWAYINYGGYYGWVSASYLY
ncbi:MAG: SH3 domain-containing protein [Clostridia bacterium]|nr:SH3 domain-containing protein [Clostridia bacterium]